MAGIRPWLVTAVLALMLVGCGSDEPDELARTAEPLIGSWTGDLDGMIERRQIRVLVPYSRTFYFLDHDGSQRGLSYEFMEAFENYLNEELERGHMRVQVVYVPVTRDRLIDWLRAGRGDVIAANLTVTPQRERQVAFTEPWARDVREVLVSGPSAPPIESLDDLSGRQVFVRPKSSYFDSLTELNRELRSRRLKGVRIEEAPGHFETGDVLEMVNSGVIDYTVADDYLARLWAQVMPDIEVHEDIVLRESAEMAFAVRPRSRQLKAMLDDFLTTHRAGTLFGNITFNRYLDDSRWITDPARNAATDRYAEMVELFKYYGSEYELDWQMLIAQGYQESGLDQSARSSAGAIGVMQLLPSTGEDVGVGDITELENNIHAGARYVRWMIDRYYADEPMDAENRLLFALASYNAGPRRVREMRREAEEMGLDRNVWFDNVEYIAARRIGRETVEYVSNIYKYYIAFQMISEGLGTALLSPRPEKFRDCPDMVC